MIRYWLRRVWLAIGWYGGVRAMVEHKVYYRLMHHGNRPGSHRFIERKIILNTPGRHEFHTIFWRGTNRRPFESIRRSLEARR